MVKSAGLIIILCIFLMLGCTEGKTKSGKEPSQTDSTSRGIPEGSKVSESTVVTDNPSPTEAELAELMNYYHAALLFSQKKWTYMIYMCAEDDSPQSIEGQMLDEFVEVCTVASDANVNIIVQLDRIPGHDTRWNDWSTCKRFYITEDTSTQLDPEGPGPDEILDLGEVNMGDPQILYDFIKWTVDNYPAEHYAVILHDHGGAWHGACYDESSADTLKPNELKEVFDVIKGDLGRTIDIVGFNACSMASMSVYYELKNSVDYALGFQYPSGPWLSWADVLEELKLNPEMGPERFAKLHVDMIYILLGGDTRYMTMTYLCLFDRLMESFNNLAQKLRHVAGTCYTNILTSAINTDNYLDLPSSREYFLLDLCYLVDQFYQNVPDDEVKKAAKKVMDAFESVCYLCSTNVPAKRNPYGYHGISIEFFYDASRTVIYRDGTSFTGYPSDYDNLFISQQTGWDDFHKMFYSESDDPNAEPTCQIFFPHKGEVFYNHTVVELSGVASDSDGSITKVEIKIDSGDWIVVTGTTSWSYTLDLANLSKGEHKIYARSYDGKDYSPWAKVTIIIGDPKPPTPTYKWTYILYASADTYGLPTAVKDEEAFLEGFIDVCKVASDDNLAVVAQLDRAEGGDTRWNDWHTCKRFFITDTTYSECATSDGPVAIDDLGEVNMGSSKVLYDFIKWAIDNYPAEHYIVMLLDHGSAWAGVCYDGTLAGFYSPVFKKDMLFPEELKEAFESIRNYLGRPIDIVGFNACAMGDVSVYYSFKDSARYAIGVQKPEFGFLGMEENVLLQLKADPSISPENLAKLYVDIIGVVSTSTISSTNLELFDTKLMEAFNNLSQKLRHVAGTHNGDIYTAIEDSTIWTDTSFRFLDLYNFAQELQEHVSDLAVINAAENITNIIDANPIFYTIASGLHGISIELFHPSFYKDRYDDLSISKETGWDDFQKKFHQVLDDPNEEPTCNIDPLEADTFTYIPGLLQTVQITGTASDPTDPISVVEVKIDSGDWQKAIGTTSWSYTLVLNGLSIGEHKIYARSYDGKDYSSWAVISITRREVITSTTPVDGSFIRPEEIVTIKAKFDRDMDPSTINSTTFLLTDSAGTAVSGDVYYDPATKEAIFITDTLLGAQTEYIATITSEVKDMDGNYVLSSDYKWRFVATFVGDVNCDGKVDIRDISYVALYFGDLVPPAPADADINGDDKVDIRDISLVAREFGEVW